MRPLLFLAVLLALAPGVGRAETLAKKARPSIAVMEVRPSGKLTQEDVAPLSSIIASEVGKRPVEVVSSADVQTMLGFEAERQLLGCSEDTSCLAEIGGALGVDYLLSVEAARLGETWFLTGVLLNMSTARAEGRHTAEANGEAALVEALRELVVRVVDPALGVAVQALAPVPSRGAGGLAWYGWAGGGVGLVATGLGAVLLGTARGTYNRWEEDNRSITWSDAVAAEGNATVGVGLLAAGLTLATVSVLFALPGDDEGATAGLAPVPGGGAMAVVEVRLP